MKRALLDTDTVSYYFRQQPKVVEKVDTYLDVFGKICLSVVTYYEVLNGLYYKDARQQMEKFEEFESMNKIIPITLSSAKVSARIYADLRKTGRVIGHNDVLIAGNAVENKLTLITTNIKDFGKIDGADIDNWTF
ncbi:MAG: type II toxin-antitoxin system VapC family toxin [Saprospiraceae bacterium]